MADIKRYEKGARFSRAVVHNGTAYLSGLTADDRNGDIQSQTREILAKADSILGKIGAGRSSILSAMIWLRDIKDFAGMNTVWEEWIDPAHPPSRATVESTLALPDILIEIQITAAVR